MARFRSAPVWSWLLAVLSAVCAVAAVALLAHDGASWRQLSTGRVGFSAVMALSYPLVGAALRARRPDNRLGTVLLATGFSRGVALAAFAWAGGLHASQFGRPGADTATWLGFGLPFVALVLAPLSLLWFPDGQLPDARRRWVVAQSTVWLALCALVVLMALAWRYRGPALADDSPVPGGLQGRLLLGALITCIVASVGGLAGGIASLVSRWRSQRGAVREQLKWYLTGAAAAILLNVAGDVIDGASVLNLLGTIVFVGSILIAVVRHDLWDIDRILNRTVVYGALSGVLITVYVGCVLALGLLLNELSRGSGIAVAASTLAAVSIGGSARRSLQRRVDRRFDRRTFDAVARIEQHVASTALQLPAPGETEALLRAVLRHAELRVVYRCRDGQLVDHAGLPVSDVSVLGLHTTTVGDSPREVAILVHGVLDAADAALWKAVVRSATPCLAQCRLQAEVLVHLAEVQHSRRRVVEASDAERRRVERNLHDGAQQRLVSLALRLRTEKRRHARALGPEAQRIIEETVKELRGSVEDLRDLAAGLLPGSLVSEGLGAALQEMALRHPHRVQVQNTLDHRHSHTLDEVAWFVATEGMANAVKHAGDAQVSIEVSCGEGSLTLAVRDDGRGGAIEGAGLTGLQDRVRASSGMLALHSPIGHGTTLRVTLPCG
jgi:signal transduction histidine kinase